MKCKDFVIKLYVILGIYCNIKTIYSQNDFIIGSVITDCETFRVHYLDEATNYTINWLGRKPTSYCKLNFKGRGTDEDIYDKYKICVYSISYSVLDCDTEIKLFFERSPPDRVYDCKNIPDRNAVCGEEDKYFTLAMESKNGYANLNIYPSRFKFLITAVKTYDASVDRDTGPSILLFVGVAVGLVVLLLLICALVICCIGRKGQKKKLTQQLNEVSRDPTEPNNTEPALLSDTAVEPTAPPLAEVDLFEDARERHNRESRENRRQHHEHENEVSQESRGQHRHPRERRRNDHPDNTHESRGHNRQREPRGNRRHHEHREYRPESGQRSDSKVFEDPPPSYEMVMNAETIKPS